MTISKGKKDELIKEYARHDGDIGSSEVQIALLASDTNNSSIHPETSKQDHHPYVSLPKRIGHCCNLFHYLRNKDIRRYRDLTNKLGLRR